MYGECEPTSRMDVTSALNFAIDRSRYLLFKAGNFETWLRFGVIIFLASLASPGGKGSANYGSGGGGDGSGGMPAIDEAIRQGRDWLVDHLALILLIGGGILLLIVGIGLLVSWLGSRGQMMLIRSVATGDSTIGQNWTQTKYQANSVFAFRIVLAVIGAVITIPLLGGAASIVLNLADSEESSLMPYIWGVLPILGVFVIVGIAFWVVQLLLVQFVMPLMYKDNVGCMDGWRRLRAMSRGNVGPILLFFLIRLCYGVAFGMATFLVGCLTCCIGFLPFVHHTLFAPYYVFDRAYSLYAIESLGPGFQLVEPMGPPELPSQDQDDHGLRG